MRRLFLFTALVVTAFLVLLARAGADSSFTGEWGSGLDLTPEQHARARQILRQAAAQADRVDAESGLSAAERQARYAAIERDVDGRLYALLTPSQQRRFRALHPDVAARLDVKAPSSSRVEGGIGEETGPTASSGHPSGESTTASQTVDSSGSVASPPESTASADGGFSGPDARRASPSPSETTADAPWFSPPPPPRPPSPSGDAPWVPPTPPSQSRSYDGPPASPTVFASDMDETSAWRAAV